MSASDSLNELKDLNLDNELDYISDFEDSDVEFYASYFDDDEADTAPSTPFRLQSAEGIAVPESPIKVIPTPTPTPNGSFSCKRQLQFDY